MSEQQSQVLPAAADVYTMPPIAPSPAGALEATVRCRTSRVGGNARNHGVSIDADWCVTTPHDIGLERVAMAMGGYLSCVELVDRELPALRELVQLRARRVLPRIARNVSGRWTLQTLAPGCRCMPYGFASAAEAADHVRDPGHVAHLHDIAPRVLERLLRRVEEAHGTAFYNPPPDDWDATRVVREPDGVGQLWDAGVHPAVVRRLHDALWPDGPSMSVFFYLGAMSRRPDLGWIAQTLAEVPDEDVAVWLCWTDTELDRKHPDARAGWLRAGVPRKAIAALAAGAYTPVDVARLAAASRRSVPSAALTLAAWHRAGCHPSTEDVARLDVLDVDPWYEPSVRAVDWLWDRVARGRTGPTRTEVGLVLAVCGTRAAAMQLLEKGVHDPRVAARLMNGDRNAMLDATNDREAAR